MRVSRARRGRTAASVLVAVTVVVSLAGPGLGVAQAAPDQSGPLMNYVVNARPDSVHVAGAEAAVEAAGGTVLQAWPGIGVVIAQTRNDDFRYDVRHNQFAANVQSVGATRTAPVDEPFNLGTDGPPPTVADPREAPQFNLKQIKADRAHDITKGSPDVLVGVNDGGVDDTHPDLAPNFDQADSVNCTNSGVPDTTFGAWRPKPPDQALQEYHGTHVAGIIAADDNGTGVVGVAPNVRIASVKVADDYGFIYPEYSICGIMWATAHHMDVTNHSYFIDPWQFWCNDGADQGAVQEAVRRAFKYANDNGTLAVAAAGNANYDLAHKTTDTISPDDNANPQNRTINNGCIDMPTELPGVVTVASTTSAKAKSSFSNFGQNVIDVAAPGSSVLSTFPDGKWFAISGTSMASPHVAGVAALLKSVHPSWGPRELTHALRSDADDNACPADARCTGTTANNSFFGEGIVDALQAVGDFKLPAGDLASTIALSNCSASVVRYPNSLDTDPAIMLTNGHCYQLLGAGKAVADLPSTRSGTLLNAAGTNIGTVRADRLLYSTMTDTDITLYRLNESYAALKTRTGATPYTIRSSPARGDEQMYIPSGYWNKVWDCHLSGFVYQVREYVWTWKESLRYAKPCSTIPGTSGSPVVDAKRRDIIGINNTGNEDGQQCTFDNPCEVAQDGTITVDQGRSYGQQTWWINTCVDPGTRAFDLTEPGCRLPQPS